MLIDKIIPLILREFLWWVYAQEGKPDGDHPANSTSLEDWWVSHTEEVQHMQISKGSDITPSNHYSMQDHSNLTLTQQSHCYRANPYFYVESF